MSSAPSYRLGEARDTHISRISPVYLPYISRTSPYLQGLEARDTRAREMAWLVRVVQLQLREKAPQVLRKDVGADELTPLLEQVVVATQPQHGWQVSP